MWAFFLGGTCEAEIGAAACFDDGASKGGLGLGEGAGGGGAGGGGAGGGEEVAGALEALVGDACNFASRFMRICGSVSQGCRPMDMRGRRKRTRSASLVGLVNGWLELMIETVSRPE
jgi:hypothetical protein